MLLIITLYLLYSLNMLSLIHSAVTNIHEGKSRNTYKHIKTGIFNMWV
jgi:hypothetical protein